MDFNLLWSVALWTWSEYSTSVWHSNYLQ
jgi:hypothetical protein